MPATIVGASRPSQTKDHILAVSGFVFAGSAVFFIVCWVMNDRTESKWLIPLFALPLVVQLIGLVVLYLKPRSLTGVRSFYWFYIVTMFLSEFTHCALWCTYLGRSKTSSQLSYVALTAIILLVGLVVIMTISVMRTDNGNSRSGIIGRILKGVANLKIGVSEEPFLALLLFFGVFLVVSYLFGFAFGFHDKSLGESPALYLRNLYVQPMKTPQSESFKDHHEFLFQEARAIPEIEDNKPEHQQKGTVARDVAERRKKNFETLNLIMRRIDAHTKDGSRIRVVLIGHSDEKPTKGTAYQSNYELAEARARNVESCILERLSSERNDWRNIEWLCFSSSNEIPPSHCRK